MVESFTRMVYPGGMPDASSLPAKPLWFDPVHRGEPRAFSLGHIHSARARYLSDPAAYEAEYHPGQRWLCGFALPPFQRPIVWDEPRMVRFVESAASGLDIGEWVYVDAINAPMDMVDGREVTNRVDRWLIDGQQRLTALDRFWADAFPVPGATGRGMFWSEVPQVEKRRFLNRVFAAKELRITDEATLRRYYDLHNFGGVAHTEDQRATRDDDAGTEPSAPGMR